MSHPLGRERNTEILGYCTTENLGSTRQESIFLFPSDMNKTISFPNAAAMQTKMCTSRSFLAIFFFQRELLTTSGTKWVLEV